MRIGAWLSLFFAPGCAVLNPVWEGVAEEGSTGTTATSTATDDGAESTGAGESSSGEPDVCREAPPFEDECDESCTACSQGTCVIDCVQEGSCDGETIACPPGNPCVVRCDAKDACAQARIECPPEHECTIECKGTHACEQTTVECGGGPCTMLCGPGGGNQICHQAVFQCGALSSNVICSTAQDEPPSLVELEGEGECSCGSMGC